MGKQKEKIDAMVYWTQDLMALYPIGKRSHVGDGRHSSSGAISSFPLALHPSHPLSNIKILDSEGNGLLHLGVWNEQAHPNVSD